MAANPIWRILLIETSQDIQSLIQMSISLSVESTIQIAQSMAEAFELSQMTLPDIIFISIERFGLASLKHLKTQPLFRTVPVIALTDRVRRSQLIELENYGAQAILPYTFEASHLQDILRDLPNPGMDRF